jgi:hypothetical protein
MGQKVVKIKFEKMKKTVFLVLTVFNVYGQKEAAVHFIRPYNAITKEEAKTPIFYAISDDPSVRVLLKDMKRLNYYGEIVKNSKRCFILSYYDEYNQFVQNYYYEPFDTVFDVPIREPKLSQNTIDHLILAMYRERGYEVNLKEVIKVEPKTN